MPATDTIRQQAHSLVSAHGEDAPIQAAVRAQALFDRGDRVGSDLWKRIGNMTNVLLSKTLHDTIVDPMRRNSVQPLVPVDGTLTMDDLPPPNIRRWINLRKAEVVAAVRIGLLSLDEACARYGLTSEELLSWQRLFDEHGLLGLRATRLKEYRQVASSTPGNSGQSEGVKTCGSRS